MRASEYRQKMLGTRPMVSIWESLLMLTWQSRFLVLTRDFLAQATHLSHR
jgi:hypothetical protein